MLTETYDNRPRQLFNGFAIGRIRNNERGTVYRVGTDDRGRPIEVTLGPVNFEGDLKWQPWPTG
ncbi:MAG: hypothetical protein GY789_06720 [Hyphomicrobiales bacterium]|nr:hypothetical protein [Hyphomicrobiales bacterium]MCP4999096.1 hypothetical protein [Hyphomicrobiales bacterium]